jgi:hypothetical protein
LQPQEVTLLREMDLTAANAKVDLPQELSKEWLRVFSVHPAEAIEAAFRKWREMSRFFPAISEMLELIQDWHRVKREEREEAERRHEKLRTEQARARGELIEFADIRDLCRKVAAEVGSQVPGIEQMAKPMETPNAVRPHSAIPELTPERKAELRRQLDEELAKKR